MSEKQNIVPSDLRKIILEILKASPELQFIGLENATKRRAVELGFSPLTETDKQIIQEVIWDLIIERVITFGSQNSEAKYPFLRLTKYGEDYIKYTEPNYFIPDDYISEIKSQIPDLDEIIVQYLFEAMSSFRRQLWFGSAVLIGAAAERAVLILLESILFWEKSETNKKKIKTLLQRPSLPSIFEIIRVTIERLIKDSSIPYKIHEGSINHLVSLFDMIRVQRNDAVHPAIAMVSKNKIFVALQTFPTALFVTKNISEWFLHNSKNKNA